MIDLHLHTTASDGLLDPESLVGRAAGAGLATIAVTDHDTVAGVAEAQAAGAGLGVRVIAGIEITAVENGRDVHILGYFVDVSSDRLAAFLTTQRQHRLHRVRAMAERLAALGLPIDVQPLLLAAEAGTRSIGRPAIADALIAAGHAVSRNDAFARLLGRGQPAFVARAGTPGTEVIATIHSAGGIASLAHPGIANDDALIPPLVEAGLDAIEVWHSDHTPAHQQHYFALAERLGIAKSGGSDYHGDGVHRACTLGGVTLPDLEFERLQALAGGRQ